MGDMKKKTILIMIFISLLLSNVSAIDAGITMGTFSGGTHFEEGTYVTFGFITGVSKRIEFESSLVSQITPSPLANIKLKTSFSYALVAPVYYMGEKDPLYLNIFVSLGIMNSLPFDNTWGPFITLTPISAGGPQFLRKERVAALSLYYDVPSEKIGFFFQLFSIDFFFNR